MDDKKGVIQAPDNRTREITDQVGREFAELETASPGTLEVLKAYGGFDDAIKQADAYLEILNPVPIVFSTSSSSNSN